MFKFLLQPEFIAIYRVSAKEKAPCQAREINNYIPNVFWNWPQMFPMWSV